MRDSKSLSQGTNQNRATARDPCNRITSTSVLALGNPSFFVVENACFGIKPHLINTCVVTYRKGYFLCHVRFSGSAKKISVGKYFVRGCETGHRSKGYFFGTLPK